MSPAEQWVLCWSQEKNTLHIQPLDEYLAQNCTVFRKNLAGDYRSLQIGTRAEVAQGMRLLSKAIDDRARERVRPPKDET